MVLSTTERQIANQLKLDTSACTLMAQGENSRIVKLGEWVLKTAPDQRTSSQFRKEADALVVLSANGISVPEVLCANDRCIVMRYYAQYKPTVSDFEDLGVSLAKLHMTTCSPEIERDTFFLGRLELSTMSKADTWGQYFVHVLLKELVEKADLQGHSLNFLDLTRIDMTQLETQPICRVHGDLWMGNLLPTQAGIFLIDPAGSLGVRGLDLAMLQMFGEPPQSFWRAYTKTYPIDPNTKASLSLYQLYYALAHVVLFGKSYIPLCKSLWQQSLINGL